MPRLPAQEQEQRVKEHRVPGAGERPAATLPLDSYLAGHSPHKNDRKPAKGKRGKSNKVRPSKDRSWKP